MVAGGLYTQAKGVADALEDVQAQLLVKETAATAEDGLAVPEHVPSEAQARGEVIVVSTIGSIVSETIPGWG